MFSVSGVEEFVDRQRFLAARGEPAGAEAMHEGGALFALLDADLADVADGALVDGGVACWSGGGQCGLW